MTVVARPAAGLAETARLVRDEGCAAEGPEVRTGHPGTLRGLRPERVSDPSAPSATCPAGSADDGLAELEPERIFWPVAVLLKSIWMRVLVPAPLLLTAYVQPGVVTTNASLSVPLATCTPTQPASPA